jgi:cystathionine beta-lyase/cystathionine gamma-synthase
MKKRTLVTHPPRVEVPADNRPLVAPIYQSVKFTFDSVDESIAFFKGDRPGFYYSREDNPTLRQLELTLAELQGRDACLLTGSGVAALSMPLLALLKSGDHVVYFAEMYSPTRMLIGRVLKRFGITSTMLSIDDMDGLERTVAATPTRLVVFETPTNPVLKIADVERLTAIARRHGALTLLDNTLAGLHNHGQYDIDLFAHSLTKYASGHGDVMGGAVIGRAELIDAMRHDVNAILGPTLDPHAAYLIQRGLKTYFVRREAQCRNAQAVAEYLAAQPQVQRVRYPGLESHAGAALARKQMHDFGTIVTVDVEGGIEAGTRFCEGLDLFSISASLGSTESLAVPPAMQQPRGMTAEQQRWSDIGPGTARLSIGLEDIDDLREDLGRALAAARQT